MGKKRRLTDLYAVGKELTLDDGNGESVKVYVRKLNPVDQETALRAANAQRSRAMTIRSDTDSDDYITAWGSVVELTTDQLLDYLVEDERQTREAPLRAELGAEDEWAKDGYLEGLLDLVDNDDDEDDDESARVKTELGRFELQLSTALDGHTDRFRSDLTQKTHEQLQELVFEKVISVRSSIAWLTEYRRCEVWLSVREPDKITRYFQSRAEVDYLALEVISALQETYQALAVDALEGKGSQVKAASSPSSEPAAKEEAPLDSGPEVVAA